MSVTDKARGKTVYGKTAILAALEDMLKGKGVPASEIARQKAHIEEQIGNAQHVTGTITEDGVKIDSVETKIGAAGAFSDLLNALFGERKTPLGMRIAQASHLAAVQLLRLERTGKSDNGLGDVHKLISLIDKAERDDERYEKLNGRLDGYGLDLRKLGNAMHKVMDNPRADYAREAAQMASLVAVAVFNAFEDAKADAKAAADEMTDL